jgi:small subunit ribosomal protein S13
MSLDTTLFTSHFGFIYKGLLNCYGIGGFKAKKIFTRFGISPLLKTNELPLTKLNQVIAYIDKQFILSDRLKYKQIENIRKLVFIKSYRGIRLSKGLPVHGQRTKSNGKTPKKMKKFGLYPV